MRLWNALAVAALAASTLAARADTIDYTVTGGGNVYTFSLNENPSGNPGFINGNSSFFVTNLITVDINGVPVQDYVQFAIPGNGTYCNFWISNGSAGDFCDYSSDVYFSGTTANPAPLTGSFNFVDNYTGNPYLVVATDATLTATPEPSSLALLGTGVLGLAGVANRREFYCAPRRRMMILMVSNMISRSSPSDMCLT